MKKHFIPYICVCIIASVSLYSPLHTTSSQDFLDEAPVVGVYWQWREWIDAQGVLQHLQALHIKQMCWPCCISENKSVQKLRKDRTGNMEILEESLVEEKSLGYTSISSWSEDEDVPELSLELDAALIPFNGVSPN